MKFKELIQKLDKTILLLSVLVLIALGTAFVTGGWQLAMDGLKQTGRLINTVWLRLLLGFTLGGLIRVVIPHALIAKWLGHTSGLKGILIGSYLGIIIPGGPYVFLPIIASIYSAGAGVGPVIALLVGRSLLSINMLVVWHIPFLGAEIPLARY
ncbi:permease, partial [Chloroflexota bacterium]